MMPPRYSLGLDYGTSSVRALVVDIRDGREAGLGVAAYEHGEAGIISDPDDPHLARQHPADYETALVEAVRGALEQARVDREFSPERVIGIGIDATASTPIPVDRAARPLALDERFRDDVHALAWLWKDHTAHAEAEEISELARRLEPERLARAGGTCSSEWLFPKLLRCLRVAPQVLEHAAGWVELGDHVAGFLTGATDAAGLARNTCAAGHKALHLEGSGPPPLEFFRELEPRLASWLDGRLYRETVSPGGVAGTLCEDWARRLGLPPGLPVAAAGIDAHVGAVGGGVRPGRLVKIIGTSSCDLLVHPADSTEPSLEPIPGLSGVVLGSILPAHWGIEAGQSAVGDIFGWFVRELGRPAGLSHEELSEAAARLRPGESGLLALDWSNGNRSLLDDPRLTGLLVGQTLATRPHEVYRALIEATAFGARLIIDRILEHGVPVDEVVVCGGVAGKNPLLLEIYADVLERPLVVSRSRETCALGAALLGAVSAGPRAGGPENIADAQSQMTGVEEAVYRPHDARASVYAELAALYRLLHDAFRSGAEGAQLGHVMKRLLHLRERASPS